MSVGRLFSLTCVPVGRLCPCDKQRDACDLNCCCDPQCGGEAALFTHCSISTVRQVRPPSVHHWSALCWPRPPHHPPVLPAVVHSLHNAQPPMRFKEFTTLLKWLVNWYVFQLSSLCNSPVPLPSSFCLYSGNQQLCQHDVVHYSLGKTGEGFSTQDTFIQKYVNADIFCIHSQNSKFTKPP